MASNNEMQVQEWGGSVGERWAAEQENTDRLIEAFGKAALAAAKPATGERVLDVGCGCGATSLDLAAAVGPGGGVVGIDISPPMLAVARRRAAGIGHLTFMDADASYAPLPGPFDLLFSRFGVMFFNDPPAAFTHLAAALRPGGRLAFVCWGPVAENPWAALPAQAARKAAGVTAPPSDPFAPGPFAFADKGRTGDILTSAGFRNLSFEPFRHPMYLGSSPRSAAEGATRIGPASRVARELAPEQLPAITEAIAAALTPHVAADGSVSLPGMTWIVTGIRAD